MPEQSEAYRMGSPVRVNADFMTFHLSKVLVRSFLASFGGEHASFFKRALIFSGNSKLVNDALDDVRGRPMGLLTDEFNLGGLKFSLISFLSETFFFFGLLVDILIGVISASSTTQAASTNA